MPAAIFCERCFAELDEWVEVPSRGTVFTYTVLYRDLEGQPLDQPQILAYVKLDGASGGLVQVLGWPSLGKTGLYPARKNDRSCSTD